MPTALTYDTYQQQIAQMGAVASTTDANFQAILPQMINYAELRICRDVDFLFTVTSNSGFNLTNGVRSLSIPQGTFVTTQQINLVTPYTTTNPELGVRVPLYPVSKEFLDNVYGDSSYLGQPQYYTAFNDNVFYFGPFPDNNYTVEIVGTVRPATLSASNPTTFISTYLPDLFIMASMIYLSAFQRNFGRQSDDPQMAQSYESQYQALLKSATVEEARKKYWGPAWTAESPAVVASPSRG